MVDLEPAAREEHPASFNRLASIGRRFERSVAGETVISVAVVVFVLIGVAWNLPNSQLKSALMPTLQPIASATGLEQSWQMYAPDPIARLEDVQVRIRMADGEQRVWSWKPGDRVIGPLSWYRWQKLKEQVIRDPDARAGLARWVARQLTAPGEIPVHVDMLFRGEMLPAPGRELPNGVVVKTLYSEPLSGRP